MRVTNETFDIKLPVINTGDLGWNQIRQLDKSKDGIPSNEPTTKGFI